MNTYMNICNELSTRIYIDMVIDTLIFPVSEMHQAILTHDSNTELICTCFVFVLCAARRFINVERAIHSGF